MSFAAAGLAFFPGLVHRVVPERRRRAGAAEAVGRQPRVGLHELRHRARVARQRAGRLVAAAARPLPHCRAEIPWRYPAVELATAVLVAACFSCSASRPTRCSPRASAPSSSSISAIDIERRIIPNNIVVPAAAIVLVANTVDRPVGRVAGRPASPLPCSSARRAGLPAGMGMGDVKLALLLGVASGATCRSRSSSGCSRRSSRPRAVRPARDGGAEDGDPVRPRSWPSAGLVALFAGKPLLDAYLTLL